VREGHVSEYDPRRLMKISIAAAIQWWRTRVKSAPDARGRGPWTPISSGRLAVEIAIDGAQKVISRVCEPPVT
jgi:hypothetical protein